MARLTYHPETRTTTLLFGPFDKPLAEADVSLIARVIAKSTALGYTVARLETATDVTLVAIITAERTQPFARVRELVPGAVVTAPVGEATAQEAPR